MLAPVLRYMIYALCSVELPEGRRMGRNGLIMDPIVTYSARSEATNYPWSQQITPMIIDTRN